MIDPLVALLLTGVKVSETGQTESGAMELQLAAAVTVGSDDAIAVMSNDALPQLVIFSVWLPELFAFTLPKFTLKVLKHTDGAGVDMSILVTNEC